MATADEYLEILRNATQYASVRWWPKYVYHFTDIKNAINILIDDKIFSRSNKQNHMQNDNASSLVLQQTNEDIKKMVRFYFRPKTPTQYRNEGYLPQKCRSKDYIDANVPVPIFFAFEAKDMLARHDAYFSEKSLASFAYTITNRIEDFKKFNFRKIYSDGRYNGENLTSYRHAELVLFNECDLKFLNQIWCRTKAEYETFCYLLIECGLYDKYAHLIGVKEQNNEIFFKESVYISNVNLSNEKIILDIKNLSRLGKEKIQMKVIIDVNGTKHIGNFTLLSQYTYPIPITLNQKKFEYYQEYIIEIYFDDCFVYKNKYQKEKHEELPF